MPFSMPHTKYFQLLSALFVTTLIVSNIIAGKIGDFFGNYLSVAVIVFPVTYILSDVLTEVSGYRPMRRVIWLGFFFNLLAVIRITLARWIPPAPFYDAQEAFNTIFASGPRILAASFLGYLVGSF